MNTQATLQEQVYAVNSTRLLSMQDLLDFFSKQGSMRVSDLHLKVGCPPTYRVDGWLQPMKGLPLDEAVIIKLIHTIITEDEYKLLLQNHSVDGSLTSGKMQYRINVFLDNDGPAVAIRALEPTPVPVEKVGFPNAVWQDIVQRQFGLVLVTGITGAGKSTTVSSLIQSINQSRACRIITLEDPIEYRLASGLALVSQREVGRHVLSFERGLRDCLREDPDVIFVGEMRDRESARWTLTAAETGHLVFSTLHTRDVRGSITRLLDMFPPNQQDEIASQLSLGLAYIISQKLIPRADGSGRVVAMEILNNNYATQNLIRTGKTEQLYSQLQTKTKDVTEERMTTLEHSLAGLAYRGIIEEAEAIRWANHPGEFESHLRHMRLPGHVGHRKS